MVKRLAALLWPAIVAFAWLAQPAFAQETNSPKKDSPFYYSLGLGWSHELGLELEAGLQLDLGTAFRLRVSPLNVALIDGDVPHDFYRDDTGSRFVCRDRATNQEAISDECSPEPDTEWRAVVEGDVRISRSFTVGAGAAYLLQGDFRNKDGRVSGFASFSWESDEGIAIGLRAGPEYAALQVRQKF